MRYHSIGGCTWHIWAHPSKIPIFGKIVKFSDFVTKSHILWSNKHARNLIYLFVFTQTLSGGGGGGLYGHPAFCILYERYHEKP